MEIGGGVEIVYIELRESGEKISGNWLNEKSKSFETTHVLFDVCILLQHLVTSQILIVNIIIAYLSLPYRIIEYQLPQTNTGPIIRIETPKRHGFLNLGLIRDTFSKRS